MDPITTSIVAALATGVTGGAAKTVEGVLINAYASLKATLTHKLGDKNPVIQAVTDLEKQPDSAPHRAALKTAVAAAQADQDPDIMRAAMYLLDRLEEHPDGGQNIQKTLNS